MAEKIIARLRIKETHFAPLYRHRPMLQRPYGLSNRSYRDDELIIAEEDPEETALFSHENDPAEDIEIIGQGPNSPRNIY